MEEKKDNRGEVLGTSLGITTTKIEQGMIVLYQGGWYRVRSCFKHTVNLGAVFGSHLYHKKVPIGDVVEDEKAWYANWQKSETYRCM